MYRATGCELLVTSVYNYFRPRVGGKLFSWKQSPLHGPMRRARRNLSGMYTHDILHVDMRAPDDILDSPCAHEYLQRMMV